MFTRLAAVCAAALTSLALMAPQALADTTSPTVQAPQQQALPVTDGSQSPVTPAEATQALDTAERITDGHPTTSDPDAGQALRELYVARPELSGTQEVRAARLLARPTDGAQDPAQLGYDRPASRTCSTNVCVHWVTGGADAPTDSAWVNQNLAILEQVWTRTLALGWKAPASDGTRGGDGKLDVYLKDIGADKNYGYCIQDRVISRSPARASSYCVLDNDFSRAQFNADPLKSLQATAAHEFFHAVQFNMDYLEDSWMMESTATWMEERIYDQVNDNRQYLRYSQLRFPGKPLDTVDLYGRQYSAWLFWEYLSKRFGPSIVRNVWNRAARPGQYSFSALRREFAARGTSLRQVFSDQIAATRYPAKYWPEGSAYTRFLRTSGGFAPIYLNGVASRRATLDHMSGMPYRVRPGKRLAGKRKLRVQVTVAGRRGVAATVLIRRTDGTTKRRSVPIGKRGTGRLTVPFKRGTIRQVVVGVANGSSRMDCARTGNWACHGTPRDDNRIVRLTLTPVK